jgi:ribonuclease HII
MRICPQTAGIDEAGRGPLAGPVVAAAVILSPKMRIRGLADSKVLSPETRTELAAQIRRKAIAIGVGFADNIEIDAINILQATFLAMRRALWSLPLEPERVEVDGNLLPALADFGRLAGARAIVGGDAFVAAISAASIIAKVTRDLYMDQMDAIYPSYSFRSHKGYATPEHLRALARLGPTPLHRRSFAPVQFAEPVG